MSTSLCSKLPWVSPNYHQLWCSVLQKPLLIKYCYMESTGIWYTLTWNLHTFPFLHHVPFIPVLAYMVLHIWCHTKLWVFRFGFDEGRCFDQRDWQHATKRKLPLHTQMHYPLSNTHIHHWLAGHSANPNDWRLVIFFPPQRHHIVIFPIWYGQAATKTS